MALRPEQTQLAFDYAKQLGVDGFETDVRLTKRSTAYRFS